MWFLKADKLLNFFFKINSRFFSGTIHSDHRPPYSNSFPNHPPALSPRSTPPPFLFGKEQASKDNNQAQQSKIQDRAKALKLRPHRQPNRKRNVSQEQAKESETHSQKHRPNRHSRYAGVRSLGAQLSPA